MRHILLPIILLAVLFGFAEVPPHPERDYRIPAGVNLQQLDTLSIIEESFAIFGPDSLPLNPAFYQVDYVAATLQLKIPEFWQQDSLRVTYRVWPVNFSAPFFLRDTTLIRLPGPGEDSFFVPVDYSFPEQGLLKFEGLESSGSITRGLTLGNRQDPTLNSAMNLRLTGKLTDDIDIVSVISDQNIPFQPDGTTQQLQDFDRVFIRLDGYGASLTAGDFELERPDAHFLQVSRKARGAMFGYEGMESDTTVLGGGRIVTTVAGAIARGKYARNQIQGVEGNQGPYRLTGNDNETFILVLAGTERVFIDGRPLQRGMDRDYIIDYNTAELTFMPSVLITRNSRIVVEFEYAERNYARSMIFAGTGIHYEKASFRLNFFSEQDHPNQPLFQEITSGQRNLMAAVGDSIHKAFDWNYDSTGFFNDRVMYRLTDSLGFDTVFVFSTDPEQAVYEVGFSYVGENKGNYRQISSAANGRVFEWVAPQNGIPQATHEPIIQLVTPGKQQMLTLGGNISLSERIKAGWEYALTNRDINLFSDLHKDNNLGHALRLLLSREKPLSAQQQEGWTLSGSLSYELADKNFRPVERYRAVEFERDWNLDGIMQQNAEHLTDVTILIQNPSVGVARYSLRAFLRGEAYNGMINSLESRLRSGGNRIEYEGSLLNSSGQRRSDFYRHRAGYTRDLSWTRAGFEHQMENNRILQTGSDTLSQASQYFSQWEFFLAQPDEATNEYRLFYRMREDGFPFGNALLTASRSYDYGWRHQFRNNTDQRFGWQVIYRQLEVERARFPDEQGEKTLNARFDYFSRWANGVITSGLFYEATSGRERKLDYIYAEVPAGQGAYIWNDYNENGIMELDEFEISPYPEEANFIRIFIPTDQFVPVYSTAISHSINFDPAVIWRDQTGWRKFVSRFSNRLSYRINNKREGSLEAENFNPFVGNVQDTLLMSLRSVVRNSLFFNRTHPAFSMEWTYQDNKNKNLLSNGFETRVIHSHSLRPRWNLSRMVALHGNGEWGEKSSESEFFVRRNYFIRYYQAEPTLIYQPASNYRISSTYTYKQQQNTLGVETALIHRTSLEVRLSFPARGTLQTRYQLSLIDFEGDINSPAAFEMLQGLRSGINHLWNINWQHNLNAYLQISLQYNGRKPTDVPAIHTGTVQLRAMF
ncbi:MAG: hypothetical protein ACOCX0_04710 [Bacteroidota bacterium]